MMFGKARPLKGRAFSFEDSCEGVGNPRRRLLFEGDAYPLFVAPDDVTRPPEMLRRDAEDQPVRNIERADDFQCRPACRQVLDDTTDRPAAAELNRAGLQDSVTMRRTAFAHKTNNRRDS